MRPEQAALLPVLDDLVAAVEDVVATGLTAASKSTLQRLDVAFKEASRLKLGRLAASVRYANDEIGRYVAHSDEFDARRLSLFLHRAWIVAHGLSAAIRRDDEAQVARLLWAPAAVPLASVDVVVLGVQKRLGRTNGSFDFRMRQVGGDADGRPLLWSFVFHRKTTDLPGEAWLHLPQPQKFEPRILLGAVTTITQVAVADGRLMLGPKATVSPGAAFRDWDRHLAWDPKKTAEKLRSHRPGPLDLEVELQEEIGLRSWTVVVPASDRAIVRTGPFEMDVPLGPETGELRDNLLKLQEDPDPPPLFGVLHHASCRMVLTPLSVLEGGVMRQLQLSEQAIDKKQLMKALSF